MRVTLCNKGSMNYKYIKETGAVLCISIENINGERINQAIRNMWQ